MRRLSELWVILCFCWICSACVDEISISLNSSNEVLVVDAWVGNLRSDTYVRVYKTRPFVSGSLSGTESQVKLQTIYLERKDGLLFPFSLHKDSLYLPIQDLSLIEGEQYRLRFETLEGDFYESSWETVPPKVVAGEITSKSFEKQVPVHSGSTVYIQKRTFADIQLKITDPGKGPVGYLVQTSGITEQYTASKRDNCECTCYLPEANIYPGMNIRSNKAFEGKTYELKIGEIPLSSLGRYFVTASVKTLTEFGQKYHSQLDLQQRNTGSIFDPAPFRIHGNIQKQGDDSKVVLGGFFLFQKTNFEELIFRTQIRNDSKNLNHYFEPLVEVNGSCKEYYSDALKEIPKPFKP